MAVRAALAAALLLGGAGRAAAQAPAPAPQASPLRTTEDVVVTATVAPTDAARVARTVTTLSRTDLDRLGFTSVIDSLRIVPGADPRARGPHDVQTDFSLRGATFTQALILVDGLRVNDTQSAHHNGDIPTPLVAIDRIEIVGGSDSAVHGSDALGGTINFVSRRNAHAIAQVSAGQHGLFAFQGSSSGHVLPDGWMTSGWASRSDGFTYDREYAIGGASLRGRVSPGWTVDVRHQRKAFGANGFYGPSPSKEWTDQTIAAATWQRSRGLWTTTIQPLYRDHGDHFRWDINRPGFAENRHRTDAAETIWTSSRLVGDASRVTMGATGGGDWIRSTNLGHHAYARGAAFIEGQWAITSRATLQGGVRLDAYEQFGHAVSPTIAAGTWLSSSIRVRASAAHAFRVPTFTELYYTDPGNVGNPDLVAERGWAFDGGLDVRHGAWTASVSPFRRLDRDVIDWVRISPAERWHSVNVRDVTSTGVELSADRRWRAVLARATFTALSVDAPALLLQSKYVLEYAPQQASLSVTAPIGGGFRGAVNLDYRHRLDGQRYTLMSARISRVIGHAELFADGANLLDRAYHEISGVAMPGRWLTFGVTLK